MKLKLFTLLLVLVSSDCFSQETSCTSAAITQAKKLIAFHADGDERAQADSVAKTLPSITNPANKKQKFTVLEVKGFVYKANYRMRFIYYKEGGSCTLMGQEILELSSL